MKLLAHNYKRGGVTKDKTQLEDVVIYHEDKGTIFYEKGTIYAWLYDVPNAEEKIQSGEFNFVLFPFGGAGFGASRQTPALLKVWSKSFQKNKKGSEHLIGICQGFFNEDEGILYIEMMTTRKDYRRKGVNSKIVKAMKDYFKLPQDKVVFLDTTKEGKKFEEAKTYNQGGGVENKGYVIKAGIVYKNGDRVGSVGSSYKLVNGKNERQIYFWSDKEQKRYESGYAFQKDAIKFTNDTGELFIDKFEKAKTYNQGGGIEFVPEKKGTLIKGNEIIKYFEKVNGNYRLVFYTLNEAKGKVPKICDAFGYCQELDSNDVTTEQLVELIKKNNLMENGGSIIESSSKLFTYTIGGL